MDNSKQDPIPNTRLTSTTWTRKLVKDVQAPAKGRGSAPQGLSSGPRRKSARGLAYQRRAQLVIWFHGGATCQVIARCNGVTRRFDGDAEVFALLQWAGWAQGLH